MKFAIFFCVAASAFAAIDGTVINGTTDKPQANATVTLFQTSNEGPKDLGSVKTDASGKYVFTQDVQAGQGGGPLLLQAVYGGVQYNKTIPPGFPTTGVQIPVFESSKGQGDAKIAQHVIILEPQATGEMRVSETYILKNAGKTTWNDPDRGTLQFFLPGASQGKVEVNVLAPGGMPIRRAPDPGTKPNTYKLDFPIKPGDSRVDLAWSMPFSTPGVFEDKVVTKAEMLNLVTPDGVTLKGPDVEEAGQEPTLKANIYKTAGPDIKVNVQGVGSLQSESSAGGDNGGGGDQQQSALSENLPKLYGLAMGNSDMLDAVLAVKWILGSILGMLVLGFILLYRKGDPNNASGRG